MKQQKLTRRQMLGNTAAGIITGPFLFSSLTGCRRGTKEERKIQKIMKQTEHVIPEASPIQEEMFEVWWEYQKTIRIPPESIVLETPETVEVNLDLSEDKNWEIYFMDSSLFLKKIDSNPDKILETLANKPPAGLFYGFNYGEGTSHTTDDDVPALECTVNIIDQHLHLTGTIQTKYTVDPKTGEEKREVLDAGQEYVTHEHQSVHYRLVWEETLQRLRHEENLELGPPDGSARAYIQLQAPFLFMSQFIGRFTVGKSVPTASDSCIFKKMKVEGIGKIDGHPVAKFVFYDVKPEYRNNNSCAKTVFYIDRDNGFPIYCEQISDFNMKLFRLV